jgi:hypothetical protein
MNRKISTLLVTSAVILSTLIIPVVLAEKPTSVDGFWSWTGVVHSDKVAGGNLFLYATEYDTLEGTFEGTGEGPFTVTIHSNGFVTGRGRTTIDVTVLDDKEGTLVIQWTGIITTSGRWHCKWVILSGTGDLANLHGSGIGVETAPGSFELELSGKVHFDPS